MMLLYLNSYGGIDKISYKFHYFEVDHIIRMCSSDTQVGSIILTNHDESSHNLVYSSFQLLRAFEEDTFWINSVLILTYFFYFMYRMIVTST